MSNKTLTTALLAITFFAGCKKDLNEEMLSPVASNTNRQATIIANTINCDLLSFKNQGPGINITSVSSDGGMWVTLSSGTTYPSILNTATVSAAATTLDMGTPNSMYGGPGISNAGNCDGGASNNTALGNVLILQRPGVMSHPLEADLSTSNSWIDLTFSSPVIVNSIQVMDVEAEDEDEGGSVLLYGTSGLITSYAIPNTCSNGVATIDLGGTTGVTRIRLQIIGSMGFDNLSFCTPPRYPCTYTQGYWKNHEEAWPVQSLILGTNGQSYTKAQLLEILGTPVRGNGLISLAHQLIAAKLNVANGADPSAISATITQADELIGNLSIPGGYLHPSQTSKVQDKLAAYNEGKIGPGHCK